MHGHWGFIGKCVRFKQNFGDTLSLLIAFDPWSKYVKNKILNFSDFVSSEHYECNKVLHKSVLQKEASSPTFCSNG